MRLLRTTLLTRINGDDGPTVVLLEAPAGSGKSWLARQITPAGTTRRRGRLDGWDGTGDVFIDDVHLLSPEDMDHLAQATESSEPGQRIIIAGRLAPTELHEAVQLADGIVLDSSHLRVTADEIAEATGLGDLDADTIERILDAAAGNIRIVTAVLDQAARDQHLDPIGLTNRIVRTNAAAALGQLQPHEAGVLGLLARAPGLAPGLLDHMGGAGFAQRCVAAGVPLRRHVTGELELTTTAGFRTTELPPDGAMSLADELVERHRPAEALNLLLDAGLPERAVHVLATLNESVAESVEPRSLLALLARLGTVVEREPALLLFRATVERDLGQLEQAAADIDIAVRLSQSSPPALRHRVAVEAARARLTEGDRDDAMRIAEQALAEIGPGEERTYARAYEILGQCAAMSDSRSDLQRAAEHYRVAAATWDSCDEQGHARVTRCDLAMSTLVPLGRFDEALAVLGQLLTAPDMTDAERSWIMAMEGFALINANRLDGAAARFDRISELGTVQHNPRLVATASWGHALVAAYRYDRDAALRWFTLAENVALGEDDDLLGVPFLCDAVTALGALGDGALAQQYLQRAIDRRPVFSDQVASTTYLLDARRGVLGDLGEALRTTQPAAWWRVHLLTAAAAAMAGDLETAAHHASESERELVALGLGDAAGLGERAAAEVVRQALGPAPPVDAPPPAVASSGGTVQPTAARADTERFIMVIGGPMTVRAGDGDEVVVPGGNQQRLLGAVIAAGGAASIDQITEAVWPGDSASTARSRLRNVLMRLRRVAGELLVRAGTGVRLGPGVTADLLVFEQEAADALVVSRADPDLAGRLARHALRLADGAAFVDFEYEDWADAARRRVEQRMISLLDLLSVQAEDAGDLPGAQAYAERALRLDRYSDSRYVRLSELLAMQDRVAAAIAVLDDAAEVAREIGGALPTNMRHRRNELMRRTALRCRAGAADGQRMRGPTMISESSDRRNGCGDQRNGCGDRP
ncbi:MAG: hypothetical protein ACK5OX_19920 [Desertimonas sp.]